MRKNPLARLRHPRRARPDQHASPGLRGPRALEELAMLLISPASSPLRTCSGSPAKHARTGQPAA